jgi:hypothetical protein
VFAPGASEGAHGVPPATSALAPVALPVEVEGAGELGADAFGAVPPGGGVREHAASRIATIPIGEEVRVRGRPVIGPRRKVPLPSIANGVKRR